MARPERPVTGAGPLPDLARAMRNVRAQAGNPGYRELAARTHRSRSVLAAAAAGTECPTWEVTEAFANACDPSGTAAQRLRTLWQKASAAAHRQASSRQRRTPGGAGELRAGLHALGGAPRPAADGTPAGFVYQLRALRAWAGNPGHSEIGRRAGRRLASSTMYDALSRSRTALPPLETVQAIVHGCLPDQTAAGEWITAWRTIALREFERANRTHANNPPAPLRIVASRG
jgi:hypothetical protein